MFSDITGQDKAIDFLKGVSRTQRIAHAYIFAGPPQVGKFTTAKAWSMSLNCLAPAANGDACGKCSSCLRIEKGQHPDVMTIVPEGSAIKIDQVRQLKKDLRYGPHEANWKIVLIDKPDTMIAAAANSFLKLLEEPAERTLLILVTANNAGLLPTIRSRCQIIEFAPLSKAGVAKILQNSFAIPAEQAKEQAELSGGALAEAIAAQDQEVAGLVREIESREFRDVFTSFKTAKQLSDQKDNILPALNLLMNRARQKNNWSEMRLIIETLGKLRYNVNKTLLLEVFLLKLGEERSKQKVGAK